MKLQYKLIKLLIVYTVCILGVHIAFSTNSSIAYDLNISTHQLGNYQFNIESHEIPSNEYIPILDKSYFSYSSAILNTEIENLKPSALYHGKTVAKVDIIFALGDTSQSERLQAFIPSFTQMLEQAGNYIDAHVEQVKTSTIDMSSFGARDIFNTWRKMPVSNGRGQEIWELDESKGTIYAEGIRKKDGQSFHHRSTAIIDDSESGFETTDFTMEFSYEALGPDGEASYHNVSTNGWSNHTSGALFRYTEDSSGRWKAYALLIGDANGTSYRGNLTNKGGISLVKIENGDPDWLPGTYGGNLFISWHVGVKDTSGALTYPYADWEGDYPIGVKRAGEGSTVQRVTALQSRAIVNTDSHDFTIECKGNNIRVYCGGILQLDVTDIYEEPYSNGTYGFFSFSSPNIHFSNVKITKGEKKSLGQAISNAVWREDAARIIIHAADTIPDDFKDPYSEDYVYTLTKLINTNGYLINLGTNENKNALIAMGNRMQTSFGESRHLYINSKNPDIETAMTEAEKWIEELLRTLSKPADWILVNEEVIWETTYNDTEFDPPLNYGQNEYDINISTSWGLSLTNLYTETKLLAEKWRYRHTPTYFDNYTDVEEFHNTWLEDPISIFTSPGKYRVNYKRRDNPFYSDVSTSNIFDGYRYFSTDYDRLSSLSQGGISYE